MFGFLKGKKVDVYAPAEGPLLDITAVPDNVFSQKMLGDGFAVEPQDDTIYAPAEGKVIQVADTHHAVVLDCSGVQVMIHVGLDTVALNGHGFKLCISEGDVVKKGTPLLQFDRAYIQSQGKPLTTVVAILNADEVVAALDKQWNCGEPVLVLRLH
jgi:PTS system glucose-specific IIA component